MAAKDDELPAFHCYCIGVTRQQVIDAFEKGSRAVEDLRRSIRVCTGCSTCRPDLEALIEALRRRAD